MSKSGLFKTGVAKKYWMALTGLFLCLFLVGHLVGNLQLLKEGEEGRRAFNEYAYFMSHNPAIKILSYLTYISILLHAIDGIIIKIKNKKARPINYAYSKPEKNSSFASRNMALLGVLIMIFIAAHMQHFWYKMKISQADFPLHTLVKQVDNQGYDESTGELTTTKQDVNLVLLTNGSYQPLDLNDKENIVLKNGTEIYSKKLDTKVAEGYKDLHSLTASFFGQDKTAYGFPPNDKAPFAVAFYVLCMAVLAFHLWHGFSSAFQTLGLRVKQYKPLLITVGKIFAVVVPGLFAIIPIFLYFTK
jgi:succinate dehydrogenase / fumarate reductase, cytochrome b subunit